MFIFFPLPDSYLMMSECSYSWCAGSVFGISLCCLCLSPNTCSVATNQARNQGGAGEAKSPLQTFSPPLEKCVGYSLKILYIVQKIWAPLRKLCPSWCLKLVTGLRLTIFVLLCYSSTLVIWIVSLTQNKYCYYYYKYHKVRHRIQIKNFDWWRWCHIDGSQHS